MVGKASELKCPVPAAVPTVNFGNLTKFIHTIIYKNTYVSVKCHVSWSLHEKKNARVLGHKVGEQGHRDTNSLEAA